jgi:hypothetical protein
MKKKHLYFALFFVFIFTLILFLIYKPKLQQGKFSRTIKSIKLSPPQILPDLGFINNVIPYKNRYYINRLNNVLITDTNGKIINTLYCKIDNDPYELFIGFDVDSTGIYIQDARHNAISTLNFKGDITSQVRINDNIGRSVYLKADVYLYKTLTKSDNYLNAKLKVENFRADTGHTINLLPLTNDNGIGTDGFFVKSREDSAEIFHIYYYMSAVLQFDINGKYKHKFNSIDGSNILPEAIKTPMGHVPSPHAAIIHPAASADNKYLYIVSNVISNNETPEDAEKNIIIDVYDLVKLNYLFSFYLPKNGYGTISNLTISNNKIFIIQKSQTLTIYNILK